MCVCGCSLCVSCTKCGVYLEIGTDREMLVGRAAKLRTHSHHDGETGESDVCRLSEEEKS